jgi:hypothetical protein
MIDVFVLPGIIVNLSSFLEPLGEENYSAWVEDLDRKYTWGDNEFSLVDLEDAFDEEYGPLKELIQELCNAYPVATIYLNLAG